MKRKLLLIDADPYMLHLLQPEVTEHDVQVVMVDNAIKAHALLSREDFELIVMDLDLPYLHGLEALPKIKGTYPDLPVVIHTAFNFYRRQKNAKLAEHYVLKHRTLKPLVRVLDQVMGQPLRLLPSSSSAMVPGGRPGVCT